MKNRNPVSGYVIAWLTAGMALACSQDRVPAPGQTTPAPIEQMGTNQILADTLAVVNYEAGNFVSFYEFAPGEVAVRHSLSAVPKPGQRSARLAAAQRVDAVLDRLSAQNTSLVDIYKAIAPTPDAHVMQRLRRAQLALNEAKTAPKSAQPALDELPPAEPPRLSSARPAATGCAPDYYNDNYGAQWFIDHYINENRFRRSMTNQPYVRMVTENDSWTKVAAMAADFETGIHFSGKRFLECPLFGIGGGCRWENRWGFDIAPRGVEVWHIYSSKKYSSHAAGYDPCRRVHLGVCNDTDKINAYTF